MAAAQPLPPRAPGEPHTLDLTNRCTHEVSVALYYMPAGGSGAGAPADCQAWQPPPDANTTGLCMQYRWVVPAGGRARLGSHAPAAGASLLLGFLQQDTAVYPVGSTKDM